MRISWRQWKLGMFVALGLSLFVALAGSRRFVTLTWEYQAGTAVSFNVRALATNSFARPSYSWPVVTNTPGHAVSLLIDKSARCVWFGLTAVDTNGLESDFATGR